MPDKPTTRNVSLTPEIEAFIAGRIASRRFRNASEVMRAALHLPERTEPPKDAPARWGRDAGTSHNPERT